VIDCGVLSTPNVCAAPIFIISVVFGAEAYGAGGLFVHGTSQSVLGLRGVLQWLTPAPSLGKSSGRLRRVCQPRSVVESPRCEGAWWSHDHP
jgi:hypothetical protein